MGKIDNCIKVNDIKEMMANKFKDYEKEDIENTL